MESVKTFIFLGLPGLRLGISVGVGSVEVFEELVVVVVFVEEVELVVEASFFGLPRLRFGVAGASSGPGVVFGLPLFIGVRS